MSNNHGRILVLTGNGKGKSSSAFGMVMRAAGWGMRVVVVQFLKGSTWQTGEQRTARRLEEVEWHVMGNGFTWQHGDQTQDKLCAEQAWLLARDKLRDDAYHLCVLDEIHTAIELGWVDVTAVLQCITQERVPNQHLVLTGRNAPAELLALADTVTEMREVKHGFQHGLRAVRGIEF
ncbi:MAG: cob(I)yrinic acid a,c-diamide adenosyltransferase [Magnetococcales bacterium]|nr:cob(I)yrinic acid a,c-diamide adenosyltransferase [Magnetococcales bacterium]